jgi:hypothetical protein
VSRSSGAWRRLDEVACSSDPDFHFESEAHHPLSRGRAARYQVRDWGGDEFGRSLDGWRTVDPRPIVVVEGVAVTRAAVADLFTYGIWVDAPTEVRLRRGLDRDGEDHRHLWTTWMRLEDDFFDRDRARDRADLVVCAPRRLPSTSRSPSCSRILADGPFAVHRSPGGLSADQRGVAITR